MTQPANQTINVASYNIRKSVGLDWVRDPQRIIQVIGEMDADIVAIQEIDKRLGKRHGTLPTDILKSMHGYHIATNDFTEHSQGWHGNAILYRDTVELIDCDQISIPTLEPRGAVTARFRRRCGSEIRMVGTHLSLAGYMRRRQMLAIMKHIKDLTPDCPVVIAGDFNEWRTNGHATRDLTQDFELITPGASFHTSKPMFPLDRFVLSKNLQTVACGVHNSDLAKQASDHLPIYISLVANLILGQGVHRERPA